MFCVWASADLEDVIAQLFPNRQQDTLSEQKHFFLWRNASIDTQLQCVICTPSPVLTLRSEKCQILKTFSLVKMVIKPDDCSRILRTRYLQGPTFSSSFLSRVSAP